jgi:hypothetical protein
MIKKLYQLDWVMRTLEATKLTGNQKAIERVWMLRELIIDDIFNQLKGE